MELLKIFVSPMEKNRSGDGDKNLLSVDEKIGDFTLVCQGKNGHIMQGTRGKGGDRSRLIGQEISKQNIE